MKCNYNHNHTYSNGIAMEEALLESVFKSSLSLSTIFFLGFTSAKGSSVYLSILYYQHGRKRKVSELPEKHRPLDQASGTPTLRNRSSLPAMHRVAGPEDPPCHAPCLKRTAPAPGIAEL